MDRLVIGSRNHRTAPSDFGRLREVIGQKAAGLIEIPESWTPPFVIITTYAQSCWAEDSGHLRSKLDADGMLNAFIDSYSIGYTKSIVRSSAVDESLDDRGLYESLLCKFSKHEILRKIEEIWTKFKRSGEGVGERAPLRMALVVQPFIEPKLVGHLSNERRVSLRATSWACEIETPIVAGPRSYRFGVTRTNGPIDPLPRCQTAKEVEHCLKMISACSSGGVRRIHYEWVWDGDRLWVVQMDHEEDDNGPAPCHAWVRPTSIDASYELKALVEEPLVKGSWRKIKCVRTFRECGIPTAKLYVLEDSHIIGQLSYSIIDSRLRCDLDWLCNSPIVIRIDVDESSGLTPEMLPRTNTLHNSKQAFEFMTENAARFRELGARDDQYCFIIHRFIPSKACAYSYSRPGFSRVRIDSTWGFPDSLFYYPHDSFEVDLDSLDKVNRKIRGKYEFLDLTATGDWCPRKTGRPYDWKPSLTNPFLLDIARSSYKVSNHLKMPVEMMFFVDNDPASGHPACLPWFYITDVLPKVDRSDSIRDKVTTSFVLSSARDLDSLDQTLSRGAFDDPRSPQALLVKLKPRGEFVRSQVFLTRAIDLLKGKSCIVELEGSMLTHSYYLLARNKIPVKCVDPFDPKPRVRRFGKLVRDFIPVRIESHGEAAQTLRASAEELVDLLKAKAVEEAFELFWETRQDRMYEELADLLEVITTICEVTGRNFGELIAMAEQKRAERGGFKSGIILIETREVPLIDRIARYEDENEVAIGLFSVDDSASKERDALPRKAHSSRGINYELRTGDKKFAYPLIPPSVSSLNKTQQIAVPGGRWVIELTYQEKRVLLSLRRQAEKKSNSNQLLLFPE